MNGASDWNTTFNKLLGYMMFEVVINLIPAIASAQRRYEEEYLTPIIDRPLTERHRSYLRQCLREKEEKEKARQWDEDTKKIRRAVFGE
ncbi:MAG: hypothetical protein Q7R34_11100 [Dehalococcoidia bacterium]|nr:hypothetical protein [Dehalococcoidia bacterium]